MVIKCTTGNCCCVDAYTLIEKGNGKCLAKNGLHFRMYALLFFVLVFVYAVRDSLATAIYYTRNTEFHLVFVFGELEIRKKATRKEFALFILLMKSIKYAYLANFWLFRYLTLQAKIQCIFLLSNTKILCGKNCHFMVMKIDGSDTNILTIYIVSS